MTVAELIEALREFNPEMEVGCAYDYGDYVQTVAIVEPEEIGVTPTTWSDYHGCRTLRDDGVDECEMVVLR